MRSVFSNRELCHVFINSNQSEGRNSSGSLYFTDNTIWSYGSHYCLGRKILIKKVLLVNEDNYSSTTTQQRSVLIGAASHWKCLYVPLPGAISKTDHKENLSYLSDVITDRYLSLICCNGVWCRSNYHFILKAIGDYNTYIKAFNLKTPLIKIDSFFLDEIREISAFKYERKQILNKKKSDKNRIQQIEREKLIFKESLEWLEKVVSWKKGDINTVPYGSKYEYLRIVNNKVETSGGVTVPLEKCLVLYKALLKGINIIGKKIDYYEVKSVTRTEIQIGCHTLLREDLDLTFKDL